MSAVFDFGAPWRNGRLDEAASARSRTRPWRGQARCRDVETRIFFSRGGYASELARRICAGCAVREECLAYALSMPRTYGIWGGLSEEQRRRLRSG
jgi:WhiB family redox-sensing transcriptional regulator